MRTSMFIHAKRLTRHLTSEVMLNDSRQQKTSGIECVTLLLTWASEDNPCSDATVAALSGVPLILLVPDTSAKGTLEKRDRETNIKEL